MPFMSCAILHYYFMPILVLCALYSYDYGMAWRRGMAAWHGDVYIIFKGYMQRQSGTIDFH